MMAARQNRKRKHAHDMEPVPARRIQLMDYQRTHVSAMQAKLVHRRQHIDRSGMGSGKTYTACALALELGLDLLVISAKSVGTVWSMVARQFDISIEFHTTQSLRGQYGAIRLAHGLLVRNDAACLTEQFSPSQAFMDRVHDTGVLLVIDEAHLIRNDTAERRAVAALARAIATTTTTRSRVLAMSGTLLNQPQQVSILLHTLGCIDTPFLLDVDDDDLAVRPRRQKNAAEYEALAVKHATGMHQICTLAASISPAETRTIVRQFIGTDVESLALKVFTHVLQPELTSRMQEPPFSALLDCKTLFCRLETAKSIQTLRTLTNRIAAGLVETDSTTTTNTAPSSSSGNTPPVRRLKKRDTLVANLVALDLLKVPMLVRHGSHHLISNPKSKLVLCVNYMQTIRRLTIAFAAFRPLIVTKDTSTNARSQAFHQFQMGDGRVLIATQGVLALGVSLHDQHGDAPRMLAVLPSFFGMNLEQVIKRVHRQGLRSVATVRFFYCRDDDAELDNDGTATSVEAALQASHARSLAITRAVHDPSPSPPTPLPPLQTPSKRVRHN